MDSNIRIQTNQRAIVPAKTKVFVIHGIVDVHGFLVSAGQSFFTRDSEVVLRVVDGYADVNIDDDRTIALEHGVPARDAFDHAVGVIHALRPAVGPITIRDHGGGGDGVVAAITLVNLARRCGRPGSLVLFVDAIRSYVRIVPVGGLAFVEARAEISSIEHVSDGEFRDGDVVLDVGHVDRPFATIGSRFRANEGFVYVPPSGVKHGKWSVGMLFMNNHVPYAKSQRWVLRRELPSTMQSTVSTVQGKFGKRDERMEAKPLPVGTYAILNEREHVVALCKQVEDVLGCFMIGNIPNQNHFIAAVEINE